MGCYEIDMLKAENAELNTKLEDLRINSICSGFSWEDIRCIDCESKIVAKVRRDNERLKAKNSELRAELLSYKPMYVVGSECFCGTPPSNPADRVKELEAEYEWLRSERKWIENEKSDLKKEIARLNNANETKWKLLANIQKWLEGSWGDK